MRAQHLIRSGASETAPTSTPSKSITNFGTGAYAIVKPTVTPLLTTRAVAEAAREPPLPTSRVDGERLREHEGLKPVITDEPCVDAPSIQVPQPRPTRPAPSAGGDGTNGGRAWESGVSRLITLSVSMVPATGNQDESTGMITKLARAL